MESYPAYQDHLSTYFQKTETKRNMNIFAVLVASTGTVLIKLSDLQLQAGDYKSVLLRIWL